jgi:hypothetical protein
MTTATPKPAEVTITVTVDGATETFTASAVTDGDPGKTARGLITAVGGDASNWTHDLAEENRKLAQAVKW